MLVPLPNQGEEKVFKDLYENLSVIIGGNMIPGRFKILIVCVLIGLLIVAAPVAALPTGYSVSVSSYGFAPLSSSFTPAKQAVLQGYGSISPLYTYSGVSPQKQTALNNLQNSGSSNAQGSVSAFVKGSSITDSSSMSFSQSVSVSGEIYSFDFSTIWG